MKSFAAKLINANLRRAGYEIHKNRLSPLRKLLGATDFPVRTIIDVGANEGQFAGWILPYFPQASIFCFEPVADAFSVLASWAAKQGGRVTPVRCAIGETEGTLEMIKHDMHTSSSSFLRTTAHCEHFYPETKTQSSIKVSCKTLDGAVAGLNGLEPDILIKVDVQGYEARVLRGGRQTFLQSKVAILEVSLVPLYESQPTFAEIVEMMDDLDFNYAGSLEQICNPNGLLLSIDAVFFKRN